MIIKNIYKGETLIDNVYKGSETFFERIPNYLEFAPYGFELGSVGRAAVDEMRSYTSSTAVSGGHERIYLTYDENNLNFVRNTSHWLANVDFSGVVVKKVSNPANRLPGDDPNAVLGGPGGIMATAITPYHVIAARHYQFMTGDDLYFVDKNQNVIKRTIVNKSPFPTSDTTPLSGDIIIHQLDEALPSTVKTYKFLPKDYLKYIPVNSFENVIPHTNSFSKFKGIAGRGLPIIGLSHYRWDSEWPFQRRNLYTYLLQIISFNHSIYHSFTSSYYGVEQVKGQNYDAYNGKSSYGTAQPNKLRYFPFGDGDSGGPKFLLINGELVCLGHHSSTEEGPAYVYYFDYINYLLSRLPVNGNVLQVETINLTNYLTYPELGDLDTHPLVPPNLSALSAVSYEVYRGFAPYEDNNQCDIVLRRGREWEKTAGQPFANEVGLVDRIQQNPNITKTFTPTNTALEIGTQLYTSNGETQMSQKSDRVYSDRPGYYTVKPSIYTNWDILSLKVNGSGIITEKGICSVHPSGSDDANENTYALSGLQTTKHSNLPFGPWVIGSVNSNAGITSSSGLSNTFNIDTNSKCWFLSGSGFSLPNVPFSLATCSRNTRFPLTTGTALSAVIAIGNDTNYERYVTFLNAENPQGPNFVTMTNFKFLTGSYYFGETLLDSSGIGSVTDLAVWEIVAKQTAKKNTEITLTRRDLPLGGSGTAQNPQTKNFNGVLGAISFNLNGGSSNPSSWLYFNSLKTYKYSV